MLCKLLRNNFCSVNFFSPVGFETLNLPTACATGHLQWLVAVLAQMCTEVKRWPHEWSERADVRPQDETTWGQLLPDTLPWSLRRRRLVTVDSLSAGTKLFCYMFIIIIISLLLK